MFVSIPANSKFFITSEINHGFASLGRHLGKLTEQVFEILRDDWVIMALPFFFGALLIKVVAGPQVT